MKGLHQNRKNTQREQNESVRRGFSPAASCNVQLGDGCYSSASIQQLVPNPLGRNASPIPLSACLSAHCSALCGPTVDLHACIAADTLMYNAV